MNINVAMGVYCPKCKITIGTYAIIEGDTKCTQCGGYMVAAPEESKVRNISNFKCNCGIQVGHMTIVGADAKCPGCGTII